MRADLDALDAIECLAEEDRLRVRIAAVQCRGNRPAQCDSHAEHDRCDQRTEIAAVAARDAAVPPGREHRREGYVEQHDRTLGENAETDAEARKHDAAP